MIQVVENDDDDDDDDDDDLINENELKKHLHSSIIVIFNLPRV